MEQSFDADRLYALRATLAAHASRWGADETRIGHLLIVASELASNAIRHGGDTGRLRLWHRDTLMYCQVVDSGLSVSDPAVGTTMPDPLGGENGRAIWVCRNLTIDLLIGAGPGGLGTAITATIPDRRHPSASGDRLTHTGCDRPEYPNGWGCPA